MRGVAGAGGDVVRQVEPVQVPLAQADRPGVRAGAGVRLQVPLAQAQADAGGGADEFEEELAVAAAQQAGEEPLGQQSGGLDQAREVELPGGQLPAQHLLELGGAAGRPGQVPDQGGAEHAAGGRQRPDEVAGARRGCRRTCCRGHGSPVGAAVGRRRCRGGAGGVWWVGS
ncbi:hypothetical protein GCM10009738_58490 [Kitasatospora viridis]